MFIEQLSMCRIHAYQQSYFALRENEIDGYLTLNKWPITKKMYEVHFALRGYS